MIDPDAEHFLIQRAPDGTEMVIRLRIERMQVHQSSRFERPRFSMTGEFGGGGWYDRTPSEPDVFQLAPPRPEIEP